MKLCPKCGKQFSDDANFCPVDAGRLIDQPDGAQDAAPAESSDLLGGRFRRGERIGGGLTGEIYAATDEQEGQACIVKVVDPSVFPTPLLMQRTERELKQLERVSSPAIAKVLGHGKQGDAFWIASERVDGATPLDDIVVVNGPLDIERASKLVVAIGQALGEAARVGVIHRDLSPKNVLVAGDDAIKLINFGVPVPATDKVQGVPEYVAPELIEGRPVDQRSNIYSLGAIYYMLLTGQPPYMGDPEEVHQAHLTGTPVPPSAHIDLPANVDEVVLKALERSSSKRFMTLRQLLGEVDKAASGDGGPASTQPMGRVKDSAGKARKKNKSPMAQTMLGGFKALNEDADPAQDDTKTRQMDVEVPPEAVGPATIPDQPPAVAAQQPVIVVQQPVSAATVGGMAPAPGAAAPDAGNAVATAAAAQAASQMPAPLAGGNASPSAGNGAGAPGKDAATTLPVSAEQERAASEAAARIAEPAPQPAAVVPRSAEPAPAHSSPGASSAGKSRGKRRKRKRKSQKGKFRETMWFKKGALDEAAAEAAEAERQRAGGKSNPNLADKADSMPIDQRYEDDGTITAGDKQKFSLKTGHTSMMTAMKEDDAKSIHGDVSEDDLIGEMKGGRGKIIAMIIIGLLLLGGVVLFAMSHGGSDDKGSDENGETDKGGGDDTGDTKPE